MQGGMALITQPTVRLADVVQGRNPRTYFDPREMEELVTSVRAAGVVQPVVLRAVAGGKYEIVAGERRVRAARTVYGDEGEIPARIVDASDEEVAVMALVENTERAAMSATEEAEAAHAIVVKCKGNKQEAASQLGWSASKLAKRLALLNLTKAVRAALTERTIQLGHAELLAAVPQEKQDAALAKIVEHSVTVPQLRAQVAQMAHDLSQACFDKAECANCAYNSAQQQALFAEAVDAGYCTNVPCFTAKTEAHLDGLVRDLEDEVPRVIVIRPDTTEQPIRLCAGGAQGVGDEQLVACKGCANFGAAVSALPGSVGVVEREQCFDAVCHVTKVAAHAAAQQGSLVDADAAPGKGGKGAAKGTAKGKAPANASKGGSKGSAAPAVKVAGAIGTKLKEYRVAKWREVAARECFSQPHRALVLLIAAGVTHQARHVDSTKLREVVTKLSGATGFSATGGMADAARALEAATDESLLRCLHGMAASLFKEIEERQVVASLAFLDADLRRHWKLCAEYLDLLTKSEIEALAAEVGLAQAMGEAALKKALAGKKAEAIQALLAVEGFDYGNAIPSAMDYRRLPDASRLVLPVATDAAGNAGSNAEDDDSAAEESVEEEAEVE